MERRLQIKIESTIKVLHIDLSNLAPDQIVALFPKMMDTALANHLHHFIIDVTNTHTNNDVRHSAKAAFEKFKTESDEKTVTAVIGIRGIQKIIANAIQRNLYFANDYADAVQWMKRKAEKTNGRGIMV